MNMLSLHLEKNEQYIIELSRGYMTQEHINILVKELNGMLKRNVGFIILDSTWYLIIGE